MPTTQHHQPPVVPGEEHTVETLVAVLADSCRRRRITPYRLSKVSGVTLPAVQRFFQGYKGTTEGREGTVNNPEEVGRVRLDTFLKIVQAAGYDVEIVQRHPPGRSEL